MKIHHFVIGLALIAILYQARAQSTVFTYQGRVTDNGTNFNGAGQFKFALVASNHTATATAVIMNTVEGLFLVRITLVNGGSGYVTAPNVTISGGGGSGATAVAVINGSGMVTEIDIINHGFGYTSATTVTIDPPPPAVSYWSNDGTSADGNEPAAAVKVDVNNGLFTVTLGDTTIPNMTTIDASLFSQPGLQLRIWFNDGANGFAALDPAQNLTPAPYAVNAMFATSGVFSQSLTVTNTVFAGGISLYQNNLATSFAIRNAGGALAELAVAAGAGDYSSDAISNDVVLRASNAGQKLILQTGGGSGAIIINNGVTTVQGTFNNNSDRNAKQDFTSVTPAQILDKVAQLPLSEWSYKTDTGTRHIGPMAQDFYSAFDVGTDDKHIAPIDEGGVALAAIQGLNQKLNEKDAEIAELKTRLEKLERLMNNGGAK